MPDLSNAEISVEGEYGYCLMCGESFHWEQLTNTAAGSYCDTHAPRMYGISKDGAAPYVYLDHDPSDRYGDDFGYRLLKVNRRQQPDAVFEIVGPFTDADREWHLEHSEDWEGRFTDAIARFVGGLAEVWRMP